MVDKRGKNGFEVKRKEKYRMRGLNPRPIACEAIVITTTPTRPIDVLPLLSTHPLHSPSFCRLLIKYVLDIRYSGTVMVV